MLNKILGLAEDIGNKLAKVNLPQSEEIQTTDNFFYYQIKPFQENENGIAHFMGFMNNFTNISKEISFFISGNGHNIKLFVKIPENLKTYFENNFYISFPTSDLTFIQTPNFIQPQSFFAFKDVEILSDQDFVKNGVYLDPFKDIISIFYDIPKNGGNLNIYFNYLFKKKEFFLIKRLKKIMELTQDTIKTTDEKQAIIKPEKEILFRIGISDNIKDNIIRQKVKNDLISIFDKFKKSGKIILSSFKKKIKINFTQAVNFFHLPTKDISMKNLDYLLYRKLSYPANVPTLENSENNEITLLGTTDYKTDNVKFGIRKEDKFRHIYTIGKTGMGKSTLLSNMARSDMVTNNGLAVIDPHGDLIETLLEHVPSYRTNDIILFDVSDTSFPIGFNVLEYKTEEEKNLIVSGIIGVFKKMYDNSRGPRLEYILRNVILSIIEYPNATLLHLNRMLTEKNFREEVLEHVKDPIVIKFRRQEFDKRTDKFRDEAISPIVNKVGQFLSSTLMRNIFGQPKSKINFRQIMDEGKILLINLSKGKIGEDNMAMIGSFFVTKFQIDAMSRADIPAKKRKDFYLYIDEFQNFATESFESILSEARKYKLSLIVANQYISQLDEKIRNAIFGNVGTIITFAIGHDDAVLMSQQFKAIVSPNDLLSLPKFKAYSKIMIDGVLTDPFSMSTFPLPDPEQGPEIADKIRRQSRQRYGMERAKLENLISIWSEKTFSPVEKVMEKAKMQAKAQPKNDETPQKDDEKKQANKGQNTIVEASGNKEFSLEDIKIGERYEGLVKLKYNYGLFVTVKGVEGLLHKKTIKLPNPEMRRKDLYNIGDSIKVKAMEIKDMEGEKRIVWTQLDE